MAAAEAVRAASLTLRITEIFLSLQGESNTVGYPTVFVRTTGCPLRCTYCDTAYAFSGGQVMSHDDILERVAGFGVRHVTVTGGEPLAQPSTPALLTRLCDAGRVVSIETSGAFDVAALDPRVVRVVDVKTPASGEAARNLWPTFASLTARDQIKFVICDRADYDWSRARLAELDTPAEILFSPGHGSLAARELADWVVADRLPVRFQIQLHKVLWGDEPGR
ncbi:MAG: 7-carboxy-7-deazaguanine synthase QueE [Gammaproteobacteria bacterium]|nr:7-carboxy-7-deazaguanine synthase QueE [Gammaproteobacteria bacterium]